MRRVGQLGANLNDLGSYGLSQGAQALLGNKGATLASYASSMAGFASSVYSAAQSGNMQAALDASIGFVALMAPEAAPFYAAAVGVLEMLPQAQGASDPCAGQYKQGPPGPDELAHVWSATGPLNPGDPRQAPPGSFAGFLAQRVLAAPPDPMGFFRALATADAMNEGKLYNCYSDVLSPDALLISFIGSWNAHNAGPALVVTRQLPNQSTHVPGPGFGTNVDDHPPDEDAWTSVLLRLFMAANHGYQPAAGTSPRETATLRINQPQLSLSNPAALAFGVHKTFAMQTPGQRPVVLTPGGVSMVSPGGGIAVVFVYTYDPAKGWAATPGTWGDLTNVYRATQAKPAGGWVGWYAWDGQAMTWHWAT